MGVTWTATPQQVERVIAAVLPHAGDDRTMPTLTCVNLEFDGDRITAAATNRYTMAACWWSLADWNEENKRVKPSTARIYTADLKRLFTFLRSDRKENAVWKLADGSLSVSSGAQTVSVPTVEIEWVKWRSIFEQLTEKWQASTGLPRQGFAPQMIESFLASAKSLGETHAPLRWTFGSAPTDAPLIRIGENFAGLLMPVRLDSDPQGELDLAALGIERKAVAA